jgi:hypothetical protein
MSYTVANLKTDLENSIHGTTLNKVQGVDRLIERAGSQLLLELDPIETIRIVTLTSPIYNSIYDYSLPVDLKGTKIIDIRPQANRTLLDRYLQIYNQDFSLGKTYTSQPNFTIQYVNGVKFIRVDNNLLPVGVVLSQADTINGNGTWAVGDNATNLSQSNLNFVTGGSALAFDISASGTLASLENSTINAQDLTDYENQAHLFFYVFLPTATDFTSVELRWGSSATNYWYSIQTGTQEGTVFNDGWNLISVPWATAGVIGSPDVTNVTYLKVIYSYNGTAQTGAGLDNITVQLGAITEMEYYSKYLYRDATTSNFQEGITANTNIINLQTETRNLLYLLSGVYLTQQIQGLDGMFFDAPWFEQKYKEMLASYKAQFKSQWQKPKSSYYQLPNPSNRQYYGGGGRYNY